MISTMTDQKNNDHGKIVDEGDDVVTAIIPKGYPFHFTSDLGPYTIIFSNVPLQLLTHIKLTELNYD